MLSAGVWFVVFLVIGLVVARGAFGAEAAGAVFGRCLFAGVLTGAIARVARSRWPTWVYFLVVFAVAFVLAALASIGRTASGG